MLSFYPEQFSLCGQVTFENAREANKTMLCFQDIEHPKGCLLARFIHKFKLHEPHTIHARDHFMVAID